MRKRKDYRLPPRPTPLSEGGIPSGLVARFLDPTGAPARPVDLSAHAGRARLAADLVHALRHHLADKSDVTRKGSQNTLSYWFRFLDEHDPGRAAVLSALDVDGATLQAYVAWLDRQPFSRRTRCSCWSAIKVPLAWLLRHRPDLVQPGLGLPANPFPRAYSGKNLRPTLSRAELDAVLAACRADIEASWADFQRGRALIAAAGPAASAGPGDFDARDFGALLAVIAGRFGGVCPARQHPDPDRTVGRIAGALRWHGGIRRVARHLHATLDTLVPYVIAIAAQTFANPEALHGLRRDCMTEHIVLDGRALVTWGKGRAGRPQRRSFLRDRGLSVPNLIDRVLAMTAPLVPLAPARERDKLFLVGIVERSRRVGVPGTSQVNWHVREFVRRHGLCGADGAPLALTLASLRATGLGLAHAALGHDVLKTQALANHAQADTTRRYVDRPVLQAGRAIGVARLQGRFVEVVRGGAAGPERGDGADDSGVDARDATASGFVCADPLSGIAPGQRKGHLCTAWLGCFTCPNAVIPLDAGTLARLLRTRAALADARAGMSLDRWRLLYAPKLEIIERDILPRFSADVRAAAAAMVDRVPPPPPIE